MVSQAQATPTFVTWFTPLEVKPVPPQRSSTKPGQCAMHFIALWNAEINRNGGVARDHYKAMQDLGPENCGYELAFAKKFDR